MFRRHWRSLLAVVALTVVSIPPLHAQSQATTGIIRGTVTSEGGSPVAGATVVLRNTQTNLERTTTTNERGIFVAALLPVGMYNVTARQPGATEGRRDGVVLRLGETVNLSLALGTVQLAEIVVGAAASRVVDPSRVEASTRLTSDVVANLPNNGRNLFSLMFLTPGVAVVQGPDGDEISVGGQRGIYNNVSVDGADFNNPFFGEQRGGQRPPFTFNLDAVEEMVVVAQGANAEFGRSSGGFVNVLTRSGTNTLRGSAHVYGQNASLSAAQFRGQGSPDFTQMQFGFTLGGPIVRDRAFFFIAYDQQIFDQTKQTTPLTQRVAAQGRAAGRSAAQITADTLAARRLEAWQDTAFGGVMRNDFGSIRRTNDANALLIKIDWRLSPMHTASLKYNYTNSRQENGTFDVDTWARSAEAVERDYSNAINGSLVSLLSSSLTNEFRFQYSREDRPRPYEGPMFPGTSGTLFNTSGRPIPDTGADFDFGYRWGMPFFIPITAYDTRVQLLNNLTYARGNHLFKVGGEYNRTAANQTFIGFANGRYIFSSIDGFLSYVQDPTTGGAGGPLLLYLQFQPVQAGLTVRDAGTQSLPQTELALFFQDTWRPRPNLTVNYGLRWEAQIQPDPLTPAASVFFAPFIGQSVTNATGTYRFPSNGEIPSDWGMWQPRLGVAWDVNGNGRQVVRASTGLYYARSPGLIFASTRTANGSIGQNVFCASFFFANCGATPPPYGPTLPTANAAVDHPGINVTDENFRNPRTFALNLAYERQIKTDLMASVSWALAKTTRLNRFVDRNDAVAFGSPFADFPGASTNGLGGVTVLESTAKSLYHGFTFSLNGQVSPRFQFQANYTLSFDKADDDNERDPFSFRYARANALDREYNWSDRDQRHRVNMWFLARVPGNIYLNSRINYTSAQPTSERCVNNQPSGQAAAAPGDRICGNGTILLRNTLRKDNAYFSWDIRASRPFRTGNRGTLEAIVEVFNLTNTFNLKIPGVPSPLFNFDGTIRSGLGDPRRVQAGLRWVF